MHLHAESKYCNENLKFVIFWEKNENLAYCQQWTSAWCGFKCNTMQIDSDSVCTCLPLVSSSFFHKFFFRLKKDLLHSCTVNKKVKGKRKVMKNLMSSGDRHALLLYYPEWILITDCLRSRCQSRKDYEIELFGEKIVNS